MTRQRESPSGLLLGHAIDELPGAGMAEGLPTSFSGLLQVGQEHPMLIGEADGAEVVGPQVEAISADVKLTATGPPGGQGHFLLRR